MKIGVRFRVVAGDRQYDSAELRQWMPSKLKQPYQPIHGKDDKHVKGKPNKRRKSSRNITQTAPAASSQV